jgi:alginate O-acetyltransferase complex protein AlgI
MLFNSLEFVAFFSIVYFLYRISPFGIQNKVLLIASYWFYGSWDWRFLSLILLSTIVDFFVGQAIEAAQTRNKRKLLLLISVTVNLSVLAFFKYFNFFADSFVELLQVFGLEASYNLLNIILPVGISFYTFQTMSYCIDIYRRKMEPTDNFFNFALFVAFFPQLVAGPIERASHLLPQIETRRIISSKDIEVGIWLIAIGYLLKVFIADNLSQVVDPVFAATDATGLEVLIAVYAFAFQIFGDFAGYSSIAIGVSRLMGIKLMTNFKQPYLVTSPQDFWRHWHISLSTWLRDYLYISLGGNRHGRVAMNRNLFITMFLGGIWHGAALNFVIWGAYQGLVLIVHREVSAVLTRFSIKKSRYSNLWNFLKILLMFQVTCFGWLIFRAESYGQILNFTYAILFDFGGFTAWTLAAIKLTCFYAIPVLLFQWIQQNSGSDYFYLEFTHAKKIIALLMIYLVSVTFGEFGLSEFIYFQF